MQLAEVWEAANVTLTLCCMRSRRTSSISRKMRFLRNSIECWISSSCICEKLCSDQAGISGNNAESSIACLQQANRQSCLTGNRLHQMLDLQGCISPVDQEKQQWPHLDRISALNEADIFRKVHICTAHKCRCDVDATEQAVRT